MNKHDIIRFIVSASKEQGFYSRLLKRISNLRPSIREQYYEAVASKNFGNVLDLVDYFENDERSEILLKAFEILEEDVDDTIIKAIQTCTGCANISLFSGTSLLTSLLYSLNSIDEDVITKITTDLTSQYLNDSEDYVGLLECYQNSIIKNASV